jgi:ankyrin repeat protein
MRMSHPVNVAILFDAVTSGKPTTCRSLLASGNIDVNARNRSGWSALHMAAMMGHKKMCETLLDCGADVNATNENGETALHLAANGNAVDVCGLLLGWRALINEQSIHGFTALHHAAFSGQVDACEMLLVLGADHAITDMYGDTALGHAAFSGELAACKLLVKHGSNPSTMPLIPRSEYLTPYERAAKEGHLAIARFFSEQPFRSCFG